MSKVIKWVLYMEHLSVAKTLSSLGMYHEALNECDKAIAQKSDYILAYNLKGEIFLKIKLFKESLEEFDKAIYLKPDNVEAYLNKGLSLEKLGRYEESNEVFDKAIELSSGNYLLHFHKARILEKLDLYSEAIIEYNNVLKIKPDYQLAIENKRFAEKQVQKEIYFFSNECDLTQYSETENHETFIKIDANENSIATEECVNVSVVENQASNIDLEVDTTHMHRSKSLNMIKRHTGAIRKRNDIKTMNSNEYHIFKSYSHKDRERVDPFISMLIHQFGLKVWVDTIDLEYGENWREQLINGIEASKLVLCFISKSYVDSITCKFEFKKAAEYNKKVFLIMLDNIPLEDYVDLRDHVYERQRVNIFKNSNRHSLWCGDLLHKLLEGISVVTEFPMSIVTVIDMDDLNITDWNDLTEMGNGGSSVVYKATYADKPVAVKKFHSCYPIGQTYERAFKNEIETLGKMKHENIVQLIGYYNKCNTYIVLEYMDGGSLYDCLHGSVCNLDWDKKLKIIRCILRGLNYLHESHGVLHGDLKSSNILLNIDYTVAKLTDFGMSRITNTIMSSSSYDKNTQEKITGGTIRWMSPEQFTGKLTRKSDIWSFGLVLREISLCKLPFENLKTEVIGNVLLSDGVIIDVDGIPSKIAEIIQMCTERDPFKRLETKQLIERFSLIQTVQQGNCAKSDTKFHIYKSNAFEDEDKITPFISILQNELAIKVWTQNDTNNDDDWRKKVEDGIEASKLVLCFITKKFLHSTYCRRELNVISEALNKRDVIESGKDIFLIMLDNVDIDDDPELSMGIMGMRRIIMYKNNNEENIWSGEAFLRLKQMIKIFLRL